MFTSAHDAWAQGVKQLDLPWQNSILAHTDNYDRKCTPHESAQCLRSFISSGLLLFTDMQNSPERFFAAHRLLASKILGGFGIRFTVQYNLFAGSILGLGGNSQIAYLDVLQKQGQVSFLQGTKLERFNINIISPVLTLLHVCQIT